MEQAIIHAPFGQLRLVAENDFLTGIEFLLEKHALKKPTTPLMKEAEVQLTAYFRNPGHQFVLPIKLAGTAFQRRVWRALQEIPFGAQLTYGQLAKLLETAPRAVGGACGANPLPIIVPCHRVVSTTGQGGFMHSRDAGPLGIKHWLLNHERR